MLYLPYFLVYYELVHQGGMIFRINYLVSKTLKYAYINGTERRESGQIGLLSHKRGKLLLYTVQGVHEFHKEDKGDYT